MSEKYNEYLADHIKFVQEAYDWLGNRFPDIPEKMSGFVGFDHDNSKFGREEYDAYDRYFYGNKSFKVKQDFDYAWLHRIHCNPHHWQYWVLINDDDGKNKPLEIPYRYVIEMICDWWSFSFKKGKLEEIFDWYDDHKDKMVLHPKTRKLVEDILERIRKKLEEEKER